MRSRTLVARWCLLIVASAILAAILEELAVPAALLLGPMIAAIAVVTIVGKLPFPRWPVRISQAVIGCLIAHNITGDTLATVLADWPIFAVCVVSVIASSSVIGWFLARYRVLPGTTAVWGSAPGGASTMSLMAEAYGADFRLVAVMQYMRVVMVALTASLITSFLAVPIKTVATINWFPPITWNTAATILIVAVGLGLGKLSRLPAGRCSFRWPPAACFRPPASSRLICRHGCLPQATRSSAAASDRPSRGKSCATPRERCPRSLRPASA
jgi:uncharacterized protein